MTISAAKVIFTIYKGLLTIPTVVPFSKAYKENKYVMLVEHLNCQKSSFDRIKQIKINPEYLQLQLLSLKLAIKFVLLKKTMCSEDLSFFSCCPQRHLD